MTGRSLRVPLTVLVLFSVLQSGCAILGSPGAERTTPLPGAGAEVRASAYQPERPYTQLVPGFMTRSVHEATSGQGYRVQVLDALVGAGRETASVSLPGAAVLEVRAGEGVIVVDGKASDVRAGTTLAMDQGRSFTIRSRGQAAVAMRLYLFRAE